MTDGKQFAWITNNIRKNRTSLDKLNLTIMERVEHKKFEIVEDFIKNAGCMPSEAELVLEPVPHGDKTALTIHLRRRDTLASPNIPLED